jgi:acetylornithine deacetylase/succinyl-diaminopimelate desuccinylase-like protein
MNKHTPAPWAVREVINSNVPGQRAFAIDFNEDQEQVVDFVYEEADAHLIAAAPDLIEALDLLLDKAYKQNFNDSYHEILEKCEAAIAKARGEA